MAVRISAMSFAALFFSMLSQGFPNDQMSTIRCRCCSKAGRAQRTQLSPDLACVIIAVGTSLTCDSGTVVVVFRHVTIMISLGHDIRVFNSIVGMSFAAKSARIPRRSNQ